MKLERAFVAGATGYTGREVVRVLRERGVSTWAHVRPDSRELARWRARFEALGAVVDTTPWNEERLVETLGTIRPDAVFALLGTTRARAAVAKREERNPEAETYERVDYALTAMLLRAMGRSAASARFVYLSAMGVEDDTRSAYYGARAKVERELRAQAVPFVIARPPIISGSDRDDARTGERFAAVAFDGALGLLGVLGASRLRDRWRSTDAATLARALVRIAADDDAVGKVFEAEALR